MPKQQQPQPWDNGEIDKFLSSRGHTPAAPGAAPPPEGTAAANSEATGYPPAPGVMDQIRGYLGMGDPSKGHSPSYGEMGWQEAAGQGAAREGAYLLTGAARGLGKASDALAGLLPEEAGKRVRAANEQGFADPTFQRMEQFGNAPAEGPAEMIGGGTMDLGLGAFVPELKLGQFLSSALPATRPYWINPLGAGGKWMTQQAWPRARWMLNKAGGAVESASKGAAAGAITNPNDPLSGAKAGAEAALGARAFGGALRSPTGQEIGGALSRYGVPAGVGYAFGGLPGAATGGTLGHIAQHVGKSARHTAHRFYSPLGQSLDRFGRAVFDSAGRFLGYMPAAIGAQGGRASAGNQPNVSGPPRVAPPPPFDIPGGQSDAQPGPSQNQ